MARLFSRPEATRSLEAAQTWIERCLVQDHSLFTAKDLWTPVLIEEVKRAFVDHPDDGPDGFMTKLKGQMRGATPGAQQLMAEMLWAIHLFPTNIRPRTKRAQVQEIWDLSGQPFPAGEFLLSDEALRGIGSGGQGYNNYRWQEIVYLIRLVSSLKTKPTVERKSIFTDYDGFFTWIESVPRNGKRQFKHMLRYFAFPDRVERMSSNNDRRSILEDFGIGSKEEIRTWDDKRLDDALQGLRSKLEVQHPGTVLDFYDDPLRQQWQRNGEEEESEEVEVEQPLLTHAEPINLIYYGPPGTGKTYALQQLHKVYTDQPGAVDKDTWRQEQVARYGWRPVIAAALADLNRPARVPEIREHPWVVAKTKERGRSSHTVLQTIWGYLQEHTPLNVTTVHSAIRREPGLFSKRSTGEWELLEDWEQLDDEAAELRRLLKKGPSGALDPIKRYRTVTFHPSFTYEDFVRGIRPVANGADGSTQFRLVDGVFKQICDEARVNPTKRYALFIDEINRANIAKVFGELITLIEPDKRIHVDTADRVISGATVQLPGGSDGDAVEEPFGVPANVDLYGTMNTADRSIALLDIALRRRFEFREIEPNYSLLAQAIGTVRIGTLLERINDRLEYLLDRDHRIGHSYLMSARTLADLRKAFRVQIIPLLQEYFFDDYERVALVLATAPQARPFVERRPLGYEKIFGAARTDGAPEERSRFTVTPEDTWTEESFRGIYESVAATGIVSEPR